MPILSPTPADAERFWTHVNKTDGCWLWTASLKRGYGRFLMRDAQGKQKPTRAHRVAYLLEVGPIPDGLILDHRCHNTICVKPEHLRPVTVKQNMENLSGPQSGTKSGYRGVHWKSREQRWLVAVGHNGKRHYGGYYKDPHEAAKVAQELRLKLFTHNEADKKQAA